MAKGSPGGNRTHSPEVKAQYLLQSISGQQFGVGDGIRTRIYRDENPVSYAN
jgi:hypothetical protein